MLLRSWVRLPVEVNFKVRIKKIPSFVLRQSTGLRSGPVMVVVFVPHRCCHILTWATVPLCMSGAGFRGFLDLREVFLIQCPGALTLCRSSFFLAVAVRGDRKYSVLVSHKILC